MTRTLAYVGTNVLDIPKGSKRPKQPYATDGNTILTLFGAWFFEAVNRKVAVFNEGRAVAYAALCRIFCRKGGRPFTAANLARFYSAILLGLEEDDIIVSSSILLNSRKIFVYELEGSHIMIPKYAEVIKKILTLDSPSSPYPDLLRSACVTILSSLICLPSHYGELNQMYVDLKTSVLETLNKALQVEKDQNNIQHLLWCAAVFMFEYVQTDQTVAPTFITTILKLVKNASTDTPVQSHPPEVFQTIFEVLSALTPLKDAINESDKKLVSQLVTDLSHFIVLQMNLFRNNKRQPNAVSKLVSESFYCITDWIMAAYEMVFAYKEKVKIVLNAIETGLNADKYAKKPMPETAEIREAAEYLLAHLLNHVGRFPPSNGIINSSTESSEESGLLSDSESPDKSKFTRFFILDDNYIFTVIERPEGGVSVIVRDVTGKYLWDANLLFGDKKESYVPYEDANYSGNKTNRGLSGFTKQSPENETLLRNMSGTRIITNRPSTSAFADLIQKQQKVEDSLPPFEEDLRCFPPEVPSKFHGECKFQYSRLLLSHLGLFDVDLQKRFCQLQSNHKLLRSIKILDMSAQREAHKIGVVYVKEGQDQQEDIFRLESASESFSQFTEDIGWYVPLATHTGFIGGLDKKLSTGKVAPYFCNYKMETIFHVPTMMPTKKGEIQQIHKKRHVGNDHVNVVWTEHTREYRKDTISSQFNFVQIVIYPLKSGLFRIQIHKKDEHMATFGPLFDGMIVTKRILGKLVRTTAINANRLARASQQGFTRPYAARKKLILEIATRYKDQIHCSTYLASLFTAKKAVLGSELGKKSSMNSASSSPVSSSNSGAPSNSNASAANGGDSPTSPGGKDTAARRKTLLPPAGSKK